MKRALGALALAIAGPLGLAACTDPPPPPPTPDPFEEAAGCYTYALWDIAFSGEIDTFANAPYLTSGDGSCTGVRVEAPDYLGTNTFVHASTSAEAKALCEELDPSDRTYTPYPLSQLSTSPTFPLDDVWTCVY